MKILREKASYLQHWRVLFVLAILVSTNAYGFFLTKNGPTLFDTSLLLWFRNSTDIAYLAGPEWITKFWLFLTWLGDTTPRIVVALLTVISLFLIHRWRHALLIICVLVSGITLSTILKYWVGRPRPQIVPHLDHVSSMSFPSGHTFNSTLFYLVIALVVAPLIANKYIRSSLYTLAIILSVATGVSRVALGVHWPSDVIAGWLIAAIWVFLWVEIAKHYWPKITLS